MVLGAVSLGNIFDVISSGFSAVVNFISLLMDDLVVLEELFKTLLFIPTSIQTLVWNPISVCMGIVISVSTIKTLVGALL